MISNREQGLSPCSSPGLPKDTCQLRGAGGVQPKSKIAMISMCKIHIYIDSESFREIR